MVPPSNFPNGDRNYYNLIELLNYYNDQWSYETKYLMDYGCHCRGDLDRTLAGHGETPRDPIDSGMPLLPRIALDHQIAT